MTPLTRRDLLVATLTASVCLGLVGFMSSPPVAAVTPAAPKPIMGSMAFDWEKLIVKQTKAGESRSVCRAPTATLDELEMHVTTLNKGQAPHPPHQHADEELLIIKEGNVEAFVAGEWIKLGPGSVIFQAANIEHGIRNVGEGQATYHVIKWNSPGMLAKREAAKAASVK
ncbi:MAG: cupin domain-containing protein [Verrucomicrobia bacterium]|nr:cupin domain-containing protein [Verrucomicrobiota bacterium]